jgi:predicted aspartyl protease
MTAHSAVALPHFAANRGAPLLRLIPLALTILFAMFQPAIAGAGIKACAPNAIASAPLEFDHDHFVVGAQINGVPVKLMLDTGSSHSILTAALEDKLHLPYDPQHLIRLAGVTGTSNPGFPVVIRNIAIGAFNISNLHAAIDSEDISVFFSEGVLGADVLLSGDVEFDFPNRRITFYKPSSCRDNEVPWEAPYFSLPVELTEAGDRMRFRMFLNDHPIWALVDTGANGTVVTRDVAEQVGGVSNTADRHATLTGADGTSKPVQFFAFSKMEIGDNRFRNVHLAVADAQLGGLDASVGQDYWRSRVIWLSPARRRLFIQEQGSVAPVLRTGERTN